MTEIEQFDPMDWLTKFTPNKEALDSKTLEPILSFTLIWNLFEKVVCNQNCSMSSIETNVTTANEQKLLEAEDFLCILKFFQVWYMDDGDIDQLSGYLLSDHRHNNKIILLQKVLQGKTTTIKEVVSSLLFIAYRMRNNLFHGEKNIFTLDTQLDLFRAANCLLARYLDVVCMNVHG